MWASTRDKANINPQWIMVFIARTHNEKKSSNETKTKTTRVVVRLYLVLSSKQEIW